MSNLCRNSPNSFSLKNMKKYYVVYQSYTEYNQFEGDWESCYSEFDSLKEASDWIKAVKKDTDLKDIIGPLVKV